MTTSIRLTPEIEQRLRNLASETGRSKAYYLRELINNGLDDLDDLDDLEDLEDYYLAERISERVRKGEEKIDKLRACELQHT